MWTGLTLSQERPRRPAVVGRVESFDQHALVAAAQSLGEELLGVGDLSRVRRVLDDRTADPHRLRYEAGEDGVPFGAR